MLVKRPANPQSKVIDGQQRLTTLTILLSVLRDLTTDKDRRIDRCGYVYQKENPDKGTPARYRLLLRDRDRPFFRKNVQDDGATDNLPATAELAGSQLRLAANASYLRERLTKLGEGRRDQLMAFLLQSCYLVVVEVPTDEAARRIFTVLNARGLDLTPTDILNPHSPDSSTN